MMVCASLSITASTITVKQTLAQSSSAGEAAPTAQATTISQSVLLREGPSLKTNFISTPATANANEIQSDVASSTIPPAPAISPPTDAHLVASRTAERTAGYQSKLQFGPWFPAPFNLEEPYINLVRASDAYWRNGFSSDALIPNQLYDMGILDRETSLPIKALDDGSTLYTNAFFANQPALWVGQWVVEWEGNAEIGLLGDFSNKVVVGPNRLEFTRTTSHENHLLLGVKNIGPGGITKLALYRKEYEDLHKAGKLWSPRFLDLVSRHDVVRTNTLQEANRAVITSLDDQATMDTAFWGNYYWLSEPLNRNPEDSSWHPRRGMPLDVAFNLAVEANNELWYSAPITLGATHTIEEANGSISEWMALIIEDTEEIIASPEWDRYADAFVASMIASGYPEDRAIYLTLDNEVWNSLQFYNASEGYATAFGTVLTGAPGYVRGQGYGYLMAKLAMTMEDALARAGRNQNIVYVTETQVVNTFITPLILTYYRQFLEESGRNYSEIAAKTTLGLTTYYSNEPLFTRIFRRVDPSDRNGLHEAYADYVKRRRGPERLNRRISRAYIRSRDDVVGSIREVRKNWDAQKEIANSFLIDRLVAYEGGSSILKPDFFNAEFGDDAELLDDYYRFFMRSEEAAKINCEMQTLIGEAFDDVILANYAGTGVAGEAPWFDGLYGENTPMQQCWDEFDRVD